jgi:hypothetical protein
MASKKTLNAANLAALGTERLADLLLEVTKGNAAAKRRLRLELAGQEGSDDVAHEIRKRLVIIARSRSFIDWQGRNIFVADLNMLRQAIVEQVGTADPATGFDLIWRFVALANGVYERCDDSTGKVQDIFHNACEDLIELAEAAKPNPIELANQLFGALPSDHYGHYPGLISGLAPVLGADGLRHLKSQIQSASADLQKSYALRAALVQIADAEGDVDGYIAQQGERGRKIPQIAADIALRLLAVDRLDEAWEAINAPDEDRRGSRPYEWEVVRIAVLKALGRSDEAHAFSWACFERSLNADHLRSCLDNLPDFEDVEAENKALQHALAFENFNTALHFLITWPAPEHAARLTIARAEEIDGNYYELLGPAADILEDGYPLAATLLRRGLIDFALKNARIKRYRHAARHLLECRGLATRIDDFASFETHTAYLVRLQHEHGKKTSFWAEVKG